MLWPLCLQLHTICQATKWRRDRSTARAAWWGISCLNGISWAFESVESLWLLGVTAVCTVSGIYLVDLGRFHLWFKFFRRKSGTSAKEPRWSQGWGKETASEIWRNFHGSHVAANQANEQLGKRLGLAQETLGGLLRLTDIWELWGCGMGGCGNSM